MRSIKLLILLVLLLVPFAAAADLTVDKTSINSVVIAEIDSPATYMLKIKNNGPTDKFQIYSLAGVTIEPYEYFTIESGDTYLLQVTATPQKNTKKNVRGRFTFEYQIKGLETGFYKDTLDMQIIEFKDAFSVNASPLNPDTYEMVLTVENKLAYAFPELQLTAQSSFFNAQRSLAFNKKEVKELPIAIDANQVEKYTAGTYPFKLTIEHPSVKTTLQSEFQYLERGGISVHTSSEGFIIRTQSITKTNEGNVPATATIESTKNIVSRLFTSYSERPHTSERKGFFVYNSWSKEIEPAQDYTVNIKTNYTLPFILLIIIVLVTLAVKISLQRHVLVTKRVSMVKTRGGEFALRVRVSVKAKTHVDNIQVIDTLPRMATLYEQFGSKPDKVDPQSRRLTWYLSRLNAGEERVFTYIIYSKINVVGNFELPTALVVYERESKPHEAFSNKTFFSAEMSNKEE